MSGYTDAVRAIENVDECLKQYRNPRRPDLNIDYLALAQAEALRAIAMLLAEWVGGMPE